MSFRAHGAVPLALRGAVLFSLVPWLACGAGCTVREEPPLRDAGGTDMGMCAVDGIACVGNVVHSCAGGVTTEIGPCPVGELCVDGLGCRFCVPGSAACDGARILRCRDDGTGYDPNGECPDRRVCYVAGLEADCYDACVLAEMNRSNLGCEYWAVDLDNEYANLAPLPIVNDAAGQQFAVVVANPSDVSSTVYVEVNDAPPGSTPALREVYRGIAPPNGVLQIDLPMREVDGSTDGGHNDGPGTFLSSRAYHVVADYPVVAYQFNPIVQAYSNDASLLIANDGLDTHYRVLGWPTANPPVLPGFPTDHSFVTIVGTAPGTTVTVTLGGPIVGGGGVPASAAGSVVTATLGPFDVLNLESDLVPGDLTGTVVESSAPVAVFSGGERGIAPWDLDSGIPWPPTGRPASVCCTDHLEEQVFPTSSWGTTFVLTHSPVRSSTGWIEPDIYRVIADREPTTITMNGPAAGASFTLAPGEWREFYAQGHLVLTADHPVSIEQIQVSQQFLPDWRPGAGGDPSMTLFPPYEQYRERYVFLTPSTFTEDFIVIAMPDAASVIIDGYDVRGDEFQAVCTFEPAGTVEGMPYTAATCRVEDGPHTLESNLPVGLMVYGNYNVGSYAFAAGTDLERIYVF